MMRRRSRLVSTSKIGRKRENIELEKTLKKKLY
jgi:hypothetical protein